MSLYAILKNKPIETFCQFQVLFFNLGFLIIVYVSSQVNMQDRFGQVMIQNLRVCIMSVRTVWDALDDMIHSVWTHVHYNNWEWPPTLSFLLDFCKYLDWLAISSKTHPCFVKETIKCFVEEFVLKDTRYYLQVRWNCSILVICMITTIAYDVNVFPGNVAWLFCKKWVNFISFIPLLLEKQEKRDPSTSTNPRFPCSQQ